MTLNDLPTLLTRIRILEAAFYGCPREHHWTIGLGDDEPSWAVYDLYDSGVVFSAYVLSVPGIFTPYLYLNEVCMLAETPVTCSGGLVEVTLSLLLSDSVSS